MTLIPVINAALAKDSKIVTFTDNTPPDALSGTGGYSIFAARVAGAITFNPASEGTNTYINHVGHGLATNDYIVITAISESTRIEKGMCFQVNRIDNNNFRLVDPSGNFWVHGLVNVAGVTFDYKKLTTPINPAKEQLAYVEIICKDWNNKVIRTYRTSLTSLFPISSSSLQLVATDFDYSGSKFEDGVFSFDIRVFVKTSVFASAAGLPTYTIDNALNKIYLAPNKYGYLNTPLLGLTVDNKMRVVNTADFSIYVDCTTKTIVSNNEVLVNESLANLANADSFYLFKEFYCASYMVSKFDTAYCFHNSIALLDIEKGECCDTCKKAKDLLMIVFKALLAVDEQAELKYFDDANRNLQAAKRLCASKNCCK
jgi:hypothetical protein